MSHRIAVQHLWDDNGSTGLVASRTASPRSAFALAMNPGVGSSAGCISGCNAVPDCPADVAGVPTR